MRHSLCSVCARTPVALMDVGDDVQWVLAWQPLSHEKKLPSGEWTIKVERISDKKVRAALGRALLRRDIDLRADHWHVSVLYHGR